MKLLLDTDKAGFGIELLENFLVFVLRVGVVAVIRIHKCFTIERSRKYHDVTPRFAILETYPFLFAKLFFCHRWIVLCVIMLS